MRRLILIAMLTAVTPWVGAQRMSTASTHFARSYRRGLHSRAFLDPLAFYDYSDFPGSEAYPAPAQPLIVMQSAPPSSPDPERASPPAEPLLIELQGDRYVRVGGSDTTPKEVVIGRMPEALRKPSTIPAEPATRTTLILQFRDGHREEVSDYTIAGGALYASGNYYASGAWNRKIDLSLLDLPETVESNQARGVKFRLPSSPNEVVIGP